MTKKVKARDLTEAQAKVKLAEVGYVLWPLDLAGRSYVRPSGHGVVSFEQALDEIEDGPEAA